MVCFCLLGSVCLLWFCVGVGLVIVVGYVWYVELAVLVCLSCVWYSGFGCGLVVCVFFLVNVSLDRGIF